jgi:Fe-S cluster biogenesis protein NfuA
VAGEKEFQEKIRQLGTLVGELDQRPDIGSGATARELVQLLMEVHGAGLERMLEIVFESGDQGSVIIDKLGRDPVVRNLLLLYSLHPDDLETRVLKAIDAAGARLRKFDSRVELLGMQDGAVQLRLHTSGHACGSTTKNLRAVVEESLYEMAPDLTSLTITSPEDDSASGFVSLENLLKHSSALAAHGADMNSSD